MRAEKLGIALQRFRKYSSSFHAGTAGFVAEKRRRFVPFSAAIRGRRREAVFVRRISWDVSARAVDFGFVILNRRSRGARSAEAAQDGEGSQDAQLRLKNHQDSTQLGKLEILRRPP